MNVLRKQMCRTVWIALIVLTSIAAGAEDAPSATHSDVKNESDPATLGRFHAEFADAVARAERYFNEIRASGTLEQRKVLKKNGDTFESTTRWLFQRSGGASKWENELVSDADDGSPRAIWCRNPKRYAFELSRVRDQSPYFVRRIKPGDAPEFDSTERYAYRYLNASHAVLGVRVAAILAHPGFHVQTVNFEAVGGVDLVHVVYQFHPRDPLILRDGELWLDPELGWAIRRSRTDFEVSGVPPDRAWGKATTLVEYADLEEGVAIPRLVQVSQVLGPYATSEESFTFDQIEHVATPLEEFTLTHYNLPESDPATFQPGSESDHRSLILIVNGVIGLALLGLLVGRWWQRRRHMSPAS